MWLIQYKSKENKCNITSHFRSMRESIPAFGLELGALTAVAI
jgi:hypothetical protein